eukprot:8635758-Pyramimonas_sp.AAC.1
MDVDGTWAVPRDRGSRGDQPLELKAAGRWRRPERLRWKPGALGHVDVLGHQEVEVAALLEDPRTKGNCHALLWLPEPSSRHNLPVVLLCAVNVLNNLGHQETRGPPLKQRFQLCMGTEVHRWVETGALEHLVADLPKQVPRFVGLHVDLELLEDLVGKSRPVAVDANHSPRPPKRHVQPSAQAVLDQTPLHVRDHHRGLVLHGNVICVELLGVGFRACEVALLKEACVLPSSHEACHVRQELPARLANDPIERALGGSPDLVPLCVPVLDVLAQNQRSRCRCGG